jgi:hypothetical protein
MDANLFRLPTTPDYYASRTVARPSVSSGLPAPDSRFPGWAARLQDARLMTDYRSHKETNIPVEAQEKTRIWLQRNADDIIRISRNRTAQTTGMVYGLDETVVPSAALYVTCNADGCVSKKGDQNGIGTERLGSDAPHLFGTYIPNRPLMQAPLPKVHVTRRYEGGRNSYRG